MLNCLMVSWHRARLQQAAAHKCADQKPTTFRVLTLAG